MSYGWVRSLQHRVKKTEVLAEAFRRAIGGSCNASFMPPSHCAGRARSKRDKSCPRGRSHGIDANRGRESVSHVIVGLKTVRGTKQLRLDPSIYEAILKEKIVVGDVVYIEHQTGAVKVCKCLWLYPILTHGFSVWGVQTCMLLPTTSKRRHMSHSQKATCAQAKTTYVNRHSRRP